jgi:hypothetical protein
LVVLGLAILAPACGSDRPPPRTSGANTPRVSPADARALALTRRVPHEYRAVCAEQAAYAPRAARACPPLIPTGRLEVLVAQPFSRQPRFRGGYSADLASRSLDDLRGAPIDTNGGHWHYGVAWTQAVTRLLVRRAVQRPANAGRPSACRAARLGDEDVEVCEVVPYEQGGGLHGGHVAYVWRHPPATYVVSLHGYANEPRARAMMAALVASALG